MRSDAFDQQRELRMKERWGGGFGDESCAEDGRGNDNDCWWWEQM